MSLSSTPLEEHREYLADRLRLSAFSQALTEIVKPGDVVLDLGTGTGVLGLLACRAGAQRVYSVDATEILGLARQICRANGLQERIVHIKGLSTRVDLPEKVDVVVADQIGSFGINAGLLKYFSDARERFLKPEGQMVPSDVEMIVALVESPQIWDQLEFWKSSPAGLNFSPARSLAANTCYPCRLKPEDLLSSPALLISLDLGRATSAPIEMESSITASREGLLHGIGGWFSSHLSRNVVMTNSPLARDSIDRRNIFFPIDQPVQLQSGDRVQITMHIAPTEMIMTWKVDVWSRGSISTDQPFRKARFRHSTFQGMPLCPEDLRRTQLDYTPTLTPRAEARLSVLTLCDGRRRVTEIEREVFRRHPNVFRSIDEASTFVADVVMRHSQ